jgi:hypothetical protein
MAHWGAVASKTNIYIDYFYLPFPLGMSEYSAACDMVSVDED